MGSSRLSLKRALLLSAFFAARVLAQKNEGDDETPTPTTGENPAQTNTPATTTPPPETPTSTTARETQTTVTEESTSESPSSSSSTPPLTLPPLSTTTSTSASQSILTGLPTLSKTVNTEIPEYPPPTIPPTRNAPFMNHSTLPDGTVFIAVGAILGAFGLAILAWRAIVACLLHRSVERAAKAQHLANNGRGTGPGDKNAASFPAPPAQFYKYIERESSAPSLAAGAAGGSINRRTRHGPTPSATPSQTNLFFSPTAAGSSAGLAGGSASNRDSARYLPSGFYASASSPGHGHGHGNSISMSTLRPSSRGRAGGAGGGGLMGPSPPDSPDVGPNRVVSRNFSTSSLNLNRPPSPGGGARAPSAYLDDLLDEQQQPPGQFSPTGGSGSPHLGHGHYGSQGRRY
ncbi:hypothetical protein VTK56DRAFT_3169 [Thermocarpiscus australiensis]